MPMDCCDDPLKESLLTPSSPWRIVQCPPEVDSTNAASLRDPQPWKVLTTRHQTAGRGRHARRWESPPGSTVSVSFTVPMPAVSDAWGWAPLATGVAVVEALGALTADPGAFALKWPNDVLCRAGSVGEPRWAKICGILCEAVPTTPYGPLVVLGVGVNVALREAELPVPTATSLLLAGLGVPTQEELVLALAGAVARRHAQWYAGGARLEALRTDYRAVCSTIGREVDVHLPSGRILRGRAVAVADGGEILLEQPANPGVWEPFAAADVVHVRPQA